MHRQQYPRPQWVREQWLNLNGTWEFDYDDRDEGEAEQWYERHEYARRIEVPFCYQSALSGIGETDFHDIVWYRKETAIPEAFRGKRLLLHFGAVDYSSKVWVNGRLLAVHEGGHTPFTVDITDALPPGEGKASIVVRAQDYSKDVTLPRGKQYWKETSESIFYTRTTGIWQTVWIEPVEPVHIAKLRLTPNIDENEIQIRTFLSALPANASAQLQIRVTFEGQPVAKISTDVTEPEVSRTIKLNDFNDHGLGRWWTPESPNLYDVELTLEVDGTIVDKGAAYFGMRKISIVDGKLCLNNRPYFMKLVLDQGYFPDGLLTAPTDEQLKRDVELTKQMGFNGARKHQKVEDPRYLYWCDRLGLLVWGEMANAYDYSEAYAAKFTKEWLEVLERDYNHPCIVAWVPLNESWGVPRILVDAKQQHHALAMYHLTKSIDSTRPVMSNDGWEHVKSDLCTIHDYESKASVLTERYSSVANALASKPAKRWIYVPGYDYRQEPIIVSEFGGISFRKGAQEGWGYSAASDEEDYVRRLADVVHPLLNSPDVQGYCYTQLTDVEQEINGLLTYDRQSKIPLEWIRLINEGGYPALSAKNESLRTSIKPQTSS